MIAMDSSPRFPLGRVVATKNVLAQVPARDIQRALARHAKGDPGDLGSHDREENERGLLEGCRLLSVFKAEGGTRFWIISEPDRSLTTVLLPLALKERDPDLLTEGGPPGEMIE